MQLQSKTLKEKTKRWNVIYGLVGKVKIGTRMKSFIVKAHTAFMLFPSSFYASKALTFHVKRKKM